MAILLLSLAFFQDPDAGKIADIKDFSGDVNVVNAKGETRQPKKVGRRLRNASLFDEDKLATADGAECEVLFPDDSTLTLKPKSEIQILEKSLPKATPDGKTIGRRIRLLVGDMVTQVVPNKNVQTDFETPSGTAAVRGTGVMLSVNPVTGAATLTVTEGTVQFFNAAGQVQLTLTAGQSVQFSLGEGGGLQVDVLAAAGGIVSGQIGSTPAQFGDGTSLRVNLQDGQVGAQIDQGEVRVLNADGNFVPMGGEFRTPLDPNIGGDPFALAPSRLGPVFELMFDDPGLVRIMIAGDLDFFFYGPEDFFGLEPKEEAPTIDTARVDSSFHSIFLGSRLWFEDVNALFGAAPGPAPDFLRFFPLPLVESRFHQGIALSTIVEDELFGAHNHWHGVNTNAAAGGRHDSLFHGGAFGFDALGGDLRLWATQVSGGVFDNHLLGHVLLGLSHYEFHVAHDSDLFGFIPKHDNFHANIDALHNTMHSGDLHGFIHGYIVGAHDAWHGAVETSEACTPADYLTPGACKFAHDHLHEHLNAFHDHMHTAFGIP